MSEGILLELSTSNREVFFTWKGKGVALQTERGTPEEAVKDFGKKERDLDWWKEKGITAGAST